MALSGKMLMLFPEDIIAKQIKVIGTKKDFPTKDFKEHWGWDYSFTVCKCGNILHAQKSYCKCCKGKVYYTIKCECKKPY